MLGDWQSFEDVSNTEMKDPSSHKPHGVPFETCTSRHKHLYCSDVRRESGVECDVGVSLDPLATEIGGRTHHQR